MPAVGITVKSESADYDVVVLEFDEYRKDIIKDMLSVEGIFDMDYGYPYCDWYLGSCGVDGETQQLINCEVNEFIDLYNHTVYDRDD